MIYMDILFGKHLPTWWLSGFIYAVAAHRLGQVFGYLRLSPISHSMLGAK